MTLFLDSKPARGAEVRISLNHAQPVREDETDPLRSINVYTCYQCLRCTNSCPVAHMMDVKPHEVVRRMQFGHLERLLVCSAIWICLSCEMCSTYCPNEIDVAHLMNQLKNIVRKRGLTAREEEIARFHETFVEILERFGRINDLQLMQRYHWHELRSGRRPSLADIRDELRLAKALFMRRRIRFLPERSRAMGSSRRVIRDNQQAGKE